VRGNPFLVFQSLRLLLLPSLLLPLLLLLLLLLVLVLVLLPVLFPLSKNDTPLPALQSLLLLLLLSPPLPHSSLHFSPRRRRLLLLLLLLLLLRLLLPLLLPQVHPRTAICQPPGLGASGKLPPAICATGHRRLGLAGGSAVEEWCLERR